MVANRAFNPVEDGTVSISASTSSSRIQVQSVVTTNSHVRIVNTGAVTIFIKRGVDNTVVATTSDIPIMPGTIEVFTLAGYTYIAAITASGTGTIYFTPGEGL